MLGYFQQVNLKGNQRKHKYGKFTFFLYCHILCGLRLRPQSCRCTLDHIHKFPIRSYWQASSGTSWCFYRLMYNWVLSWCQHWCTLNNIHKFPIRSYWQASLECRDVSTGSHTTGATGAFLGVCNGAVWMDSVDISVVDGSGWAVSVSVSFVTKRQLRINLTEFILTFKHCNIYSVIYVMYALPIETVSLAPDTTFRASLS